MKYFTRSASIKSSNQLETTQAKTFVVMKQSGVVARCCAYASGDPFSLIDVGSVSTAYIVFFSFPA